MRAIFRFVPMYESNTFYSYHSRTKNPDYAQGLVKLPTRLRACLLHHNSEIQDRYIQTLPKYHTHLEKRQLNEQTGELELLDNLYTTSDLKSTVGRKIKRISEWSDYYEPKYQKKEVSMLMHTFTVANEANMSMSEMMDNVKYRYKSIGYPIRSYMWVSEVSEDYHWHYHLVVAIDRMNIKGKGIPKELKFDSIWGAHTNVTFVRKSVRYYLAQYMAKCKSKIIGVRGCQTSQKKNWR